MSLICSNKDCHCYYLWHRATFTWEHTVAVKVGPGQGRPGDDSAALPPASQRRYVCDACKQTATEVPQESYSGYKSDYDRAEEALSCTYGDVVDEAQTLSGRVAQQDVGDLYSDDEALEYAIGAIEVMVRTGVDYSHAEPWIHLAVKETFDRVIARMRDASESVPRRADEYPLACLGRAVVDDLDAGVMAYTAVSYRKLWGAVEEKVRRRVDYTDPSQYLNYEKPKTPTWARST